MATGLWLSIPACGLAALVAFGDIQGLILLVFVPAIAGLPWNIPGLLAMLGAGIGHGGDETVKGIVFLLGTFWVFLSVTLNGAFLSSLLGGLKSRQDTENN